MSRKRRATVAPALVDSAALVAVVAIDEPAPPHAAGRTLCRVQGSAVKSGRIYRPGEVAEFADEDVARMPQWLVPVAPAAPTGQE